MKLFAELNSEKHEVTFNQIGEKIVAEVDGKMYELEVSEPEPNVFLLKYDNQIFEVFVSPNDQKGEPSQVKIGNHNLEIKISDPKRLRGIGVGAGAIEGTVEIKTAMPGKVVRVLLEAGATVEAGDGIIVVEAMKMQNEMKSPKTGTIKEIRFSEGETVNAGDVLAVIE